MTENRKDVAKVAVSMDDRLEKINTDYQKIVGEIREIEQAMEKNRQQLSAAKNDKMQKGLELQGQIKLLVEMGAKPKLAEVKPEAKPEVKSDK